MDGLKAAIVAAATTRLDNAVSNGRITAAQEQQLFNRLQARLDTIVNPKSPLDS